MADQPGGSRRMTMRESIQERLMTLVFPSEIAGGSLPLLKSEKAEFEAVFGAPVVFAERDPGGGPRWLIRIQPDADRNSLVWNDSECVLTSIVRNADEFGATLQLLHSLVVLNVTEIDDTAPADLTSGCERLTVELERGFPGFEIRGLTWADVRSQFLPQGVVLSIEGVSRLVAALQDAHTAVRRRGPVFHPPYAVQLTHDAALLRRVPGWSAAGKLGVRAGWTLDSPDTDHYLNTTGAPPHAHALIAGRRAIALNGVREREFTAVSPAGQSILWTEHATRPSLDDLIQTDVVADDTLYVRLGAWIEGLGVERKVHRIVREFGHFRRLVLDVRGNTGGSLMLAKSIRRLFLRGRTLIGTIQFTRGDGTLADPDEIWETPHETVRWQGELVVLIDALTYSASEDFLHGLQGLDHVTVIGQPSGGGSGRPRTISLVPGWDVTISTALTFDRNGHCIEGQGIPVDVNCDPFAEAWREVLGIPPA